MRSEKLPHFTQYDPPPKNYTPEKVRARTELEQQVAEFKAKGGLIHVLESNTASHSNIVNVSGLQ